MYPVEVTCSSGTYIRTLAADLGAALGGGAHLRRLRRTRAGSFSVGDARRIDDIVAPDHLLSPAEALRDLPTVVVDTATAVEVGHGRPLERVAASDCPTITTARGPSRRRTASCSPSTDRTAPAR